jgi:hypothetical protein
MGLGNNNEEYGHVRASNIEQNEYETELWAKRVMDVPSNMQMRAEYSAGNLIYLGYAAHGITTAASGWLLQKYTYDASGNATMREIAADCFSWGSRATVVYE